MPGWFGAVGVIAAAGVWLTVWAVGAPQQGEPPADARPDPDPAAITREEAVEALGESPVAAVLDVLGADAKAFNAHVVTLSNPFFEGRQPGTRGNALAADYIERYMREAGLRPAFPTVEKAADGTEVVTTFATFRQEFRAGAKERVARAKAEIAAGGERRDLVSGEGVAALGCTADAAATGPLVFVGYSVEDGKDGYETYPDGTDLKGKIALVLRFEPMDDKGRSKWSSSGWSPSASLEEKLKAAADRGAPGLILVNAPGADDPRADRLASLDDTRLTFDSPGPAVMVTTEEADAIVRAADPQGRSLMDLRRLADEGGGVIDLPGAVVSLDAAIIREPTMTDNVAGVLPGRGALAEQYIIIGAHYDHVGTGSIGASPQNVGKMHPGADDNASGTSGLLVMADKVAAAYAALPEGAEARSVLFCAFSAEEGGLVGSRYFVRHPPIAKESMYLMLNMDMIGRLRDGDLEVGGVGTAEGLSEFVDPYFKESGLNIKATKSGMGPSDHASFALAKVPVLFFFTGLHREYHTPADVGSTVNQKGAARVIALAYEIVMALATRPEALTPSGGAAAADPGQGQAAVAGPSRMKVRFGIAPGDYSGEQPGVLVGDVYEGTSAAEAGIKTGDLMTSWNGKELKSVEAWMPLLTEHSPGDVVEVGLTRDGKPMTVKVTLKARDQGSR